MKRDKLIEIGIPDSAIRIATAYQVALKGYDGDLERDAKKEAVADLAAESLANGDENVRQAVRSWIQDRFNEWKGHSTLLAANRKDKTGRKLGDKERTLSEFVYNYFSGTPYNPASESVDSARETHKNGFTDVKLP